MNSEVSVDEAIRKGIWFIKIPPIVLFLLIIFAGLYFGIIKGYDSFMPTFVMISVVVGIISFFLYRIIAMPKWKVWAFQNVRNVHQLKVIAIYRGIIYRDNSWITKSEYFTGTDREKWKEIFKKFNISEYSTDLQLPNEIIVTKSKNKLLLSVLLYSLFIPFSIIVIIYNPDSRGFIIFLLMIYGIFGYFNFLMFKNRNIPLLTINKSGIKTEEEVFFAWDEIYNETLTRSYSRNGTNHFLDFRKVNDDDLVRVNLSFIEMKRSDLLKYLVAFRSRFEMEKTHV